MARDKNHKKEKKKVMLTESNKMFEALKSRYMTGFSASWRKPRPFAASRAIFILVDHGSDTEYPAKPNDRH